jgi:hypothetical protein
MSHQQHQNYWKKHRDRVCIHQQLTSLYTRSQRRQLTGWSMMFATEDTLWHFLLRFAGGMLCSRAEHTAAIVALRRVQLKEEHGATTV